MEYATLRLIHVSTVYVTIGLFITRGILMLLDSPQLRARWAETIPHINDTVLFTAAIGMLIVGGLNPLEHPWLRAKISGLLAYIVLGSLALKHGGTKRQRIAYFFAALAVVGYIVAVAITKQCVPGVF